jgi:hypothetical protein
LSHRHVAASRSAPVVAVRSSIPANTGCHFRHIIILLYGRVIDKPLMVMALNQSQERQRFSPSQIRKLVGPVLKRQLATTRKIDAIFTSFLSVLFFRIVVVPCFVCYHGPIHLCFVRVDVPEIKFIYLCIFHNPPVPRSNNTPTPPSAPRFSFTNVQDDRTVHRSPFASRL